MPAQNLEPRVPDGCETTDGEIDLGGAQRIGVVSDTHVPHRLRRLPAVVLDAVRGVDVILHAGDVEDDSVLRALSEIAPVYAVRGNLHWQFTSGVHDQALPAALRLRWGSERIWMTHGHQNFGFSVVDKATSLFDGDEPQRVNDRIIGRLHRARPDGTTMVVFGHSHRSVLRELDGVLYFNPGGVAVRFKKGEENEGPRVAILTRNDAGRPIPEWISLLDLLAQSGVHGG